MEELESQIAKIQLGSTRTSTSYVYTMAEKAYVGQSELYMVAEIPLFNPAAEDSCERICLAIASALKRSYKNIEQENSFENAIAVINEELGKLTSMGQTQWINKLNCILGVKNGNSFSIASCGKVSAFLLRNREYTDISCSPAQSHPLKTFENFATGKIRLGDLIILSTTQLFNYLSMGRLLDIVSHTDFLTSTKTIIELLKQTADPQVAFGVLLNLQVPVGQTQQEEADLENYIVENPTGQTSFVNKIFAYIKTIFALDKNKTRTPKVDLPKISLGQKFLNFKGGTKNFISKSSSFWKTAKNYASGAKANASGQKFKNLSTQKKVFFISALVLFIAVGANIFIAFHLKNTRAISAQINSQLKDAQSLLQSSQASLLYKDESAANDYFKQAKNKLPDAKKVDSANKDLYNKVLAEITDTQNQMEKIYEPIVENLGSLGQSDNLIKLPGYLGAQINQTIVSYNKQNGKIEDSVLKLSVNSLKTSYLTGNLVAVYDGSNLYIWDFSLGTLTAAFNQSVPGKDDYAGLAQYPTNSRIYMVDKKSGSIINFLSGKSGFSKPVVAVRDPSLNQAIDLTIDGSIYVLNKTGVTKFQSGKIADFSIAGLITPFSGSGKIYTQKDFQYIYLLDSGNNRIVILDKKGNLVKSLKSEQFTKLKDFEVDEKNKTLYLLNDGSLLKASLP